MGDDFYLPNEVAEIILSHFHECHDRSELHNLRLTNRYFNQVVTPIIFGSLHVTYNTFSTKRLLRVADHGQFRKLVKSISLHAAKWTAVLHRHPQKHVESKLLENSELCFLDRLHKAWTQWRSDEANLGEQRRRFGLDVESFSPEFAHELTKAANWIMQESTEYSFLFSNFVSEVLSEVTYGTEVQQNLLESISKFENLLTIQFVDLQCRDHSSYTMKRTGISQLPVSPGLPSQPNITSLLRQRPIKYMHLRDVFWSTFDSQFPPQHLTLEAEMDCTGFRSCLSNLEALEISLRYNAFYFEHRRIDADRSWRDILSSCHKLQKLTIVFPPVSNMTADERQHTIDQCATLLNAQFPSLCEFSVSYLLRHEHALLHFLRNHSSTLKTLNLHKWHYNRVLCTRRSHSIVRTLFLIPKFTQLKRASIKGTFHTNSSEEVILFRWCAAGKSNHDVSRPLPPRYLAGYPNRSGFPKIAATPHPESNHSNLDFEPNAEPTTKPEPRSKTKLHRNSKHVTRIASSKPSPPSIRKQLENYLCHRGPFPFPTEVADLLERNHAERRAQAITYNEQYSTAASIVVTNGRIKTELDFEGLETAEQVKNIDIHSATPQDRSWWREYYHRGRRAWVLAGVLR